MKTSPHILILAGGLGKRMASRLPKVLHPVLFRPMIHYVLDLATSLPHGSISLVVGHGEEEVRSACASYSKVGFFRQKEQRGTADAVRAAESFLAQQKGDVLILSGDVILLQAATIQGLLETHEKRGGALTFVTAHLPQPRGYGRILRDGNGKVTGNREEVDCTPEQRAIREVNAGIYCFRIRDLLAALSRIEDRNGQKEFYLTDAIGILAGSGNGVEGVPLEDAREMLGINDRLALSEVEQVLQERINRALMLTGVTIQNPASVFIDPRCRIEPDVRIEAGVQLVQSQVAAGTVIEADCRLVDSRVGPNCRIKQGSYLEQSEVGAKCSVGPYAHLRPGSRLHSDVKIGNFVELKNSVMAEGLKASHLSYIGDAEIGKNVNLGCGFVTCNFDGGPKKHKTVIEDDVFVGSDSQTVAPVRVGRGSYVASGTTVTDDVPPDSLVVSRGRQVVKPGYAAKLRSKNK